MSGRFFSAVLLLGAFLLAERLWAANPVQKIAVASLLLIAGVLSPLPTTSYFQTNPIFLTKEQEHIGNPNSQVGNERMGYLLTTSPAAMDRGMNMPRHPWAEAGTKYKTSNASVVVEEGVGMIGFFAGPKVHVLDPLALGDPLLARLEVVSPYWRIGHFKRRIPDGYYETLKVKKNRIEDPSLATYYDQLKIILSGPLLSPERLRTIWEMNTGRYNYLLEEYKAR
jgi:arabinofuranosyltransferase